MRPILWWLSRVAAAACISFGLQAEEIPRYSLPVDCVPGENCWIVNYVDLDPGKGASDYTCGPQSYDGHSGTDIAVRNLREMRRGVKVVASAPGVVRATRDGVADGAYSRNEPGEVSGRECGNGVLIDHGAGWQTQYCHLKQGSVTVRKGERVERGAKLGLVGMSGRSEFPHLHLTVRHQGKSLDPFTGRAAATSCGVDGEALWTADTSTALRYRAASIYDGGIAGSAPSVAQVHDGEGIVPAARLSPALVVWAALYGVRVGDEVTLSLTDPAGRVLLERKRRLDRTQARRVELASLARGAENWPAGRYRGRVRIERAQAAAAPLTIERLFTAEIE